MINLSSTSRYIIGITTAIGLLTSCSGSELSAPANTIGNPSAAQTPQGNRRIHLRELNRNDLLYVSDVDAGKLYVFTYPRGTLVKTIADLSNPTGLCTNNSGDIWVVTAADSGSGTLVEYEHGGSTPIATLSIPGDDPFGCAVDPKTGDVAVTNSGNSISVFTKGSGTPLTYTASDFYHMYYCGYDSNGNLFADGNSQSGAQLVELLKRKRRAPRSYR